MRHSSHSPYVAGGLRLDVPGGALFQEPLMLRCCGFKARNRPWDFPMVFSPFWRLYYNFAPGQRVRCGRKAVELEPERLVLIPENVLFHCETRAGAPPHLYVHFNLWHDRVGWARAPLSIRAAPAGIGLIEDLRRHLRRGALRPAGHLALALLHWVFARVPADRLAAKIFDPGLRRALAHIDRCLEEDLSNPALARIAGMSLRTFVRAFTRQMGIPPQIHVRRARVREAARQLAHTPGTLEAIAGNVGLGNRFYLTRVFTAHMGTSPAAFRRRLAGGN